MNSLFTCGPVTDEALNVTYFDTNWLTDNKIQTFASMLRIWRLETDRCHFIADDIKYIDISTND